MVGFMDAVVAFPTAIFTTLLGVALFYWVLAAIGLVDFESAVDATGDGAHGQDLGTLAASVVALGLHGVPVSIVVSLVILVAWVLTCLGAMWLLPLLPGTSLQGVGGVVLALASVSAALPATARLVRPLRGLFVTHAAPYNASLVGQTCKVLTQVVDEQAGRAEVQQRGANLNIRVWATTPNTLRRGTPARIVAYEEQGARYRIEAES